MSLWAKIRSKIIDEWWKPISVWLLSLLGMFSAAYEYMPALKEAMPDWMAKWYPLAFAIVLAARLYKQRNINP